MFVAFKEIRRSLGRFSLLTMAVALLVLLLLFFQAVRFWFGKVRRHQVES